MTLAEEILAINDREGTQTTAWGKPILILPMSGTDRDRYDWEMHHASKDEVTPDNWRARYLVRCLFAPNGERIFRDDQADQLGTKNATTIQRLFDLAKGVNGKGDNAITDEAKNS
jgi:hypothetical protein